MEKKSLQFVFCKGKYHRNVLKNNDSAFDLFNIALNSAARVPELQAMCVYEIGFMYLSSLDYPRAFDCFLRLSEQSKWSIPFHKYMCALLYGCMNKLKEANEFIKIGLSAVKRKNGGPIEILAVKRLEYFKKNQIKTSAICEFACLEINCLMPSLPFCSKDDLGKMLESKCFLIFYSIFLILFNNKNSSL
jgi:hypothetical protein